MTNLKPATPSFTDERVHRALEAGAAPSYSRVAAPASPLSAKAAARAGTQAFPAPAIVRRLDSSFSRELTIEDRRRLRAIVIKTHRFLFAADPSTRHVDQVIDSLGPEVARKMVMRAVASGRVG